MGNVSKTKWEVCIKRSTSLFRRPTLFRPICENGIIRPYRLFQRLCPRKRPVGSQSHQPDENGFVVATLGVLEEVEKEFITNPEEPMSDTPLEDLCDSYHRTIPGVTANEIF